MTQEDKELLMKDLCARLPYGVICRLSEPPWGETIEPLKIGGLRNLIEGKWNVIPYLRPMSSMTEEEKRQYRDYFQSIEGKIIGVTGRVLWTIDWLLKNHFDFRGLIPKGLAIEVTEENNPYK